MNKFICIHGHFYQPPRENPWLKEIELQADAHPYHDWNERINAECYSPNARARVLDEKARIIRIVNNYSRISFNFGPTLLQWMESNAPEVYRAVLDADRESRRNFSGHGSALAQPQHHLIMPLANRRDKTTQVVWGIRDFEHRFRRVPEGMWLPETAVDLETLEILAEAGIRFTVLAPHQAKRTRPLEGGDWREVSNGSIDTTVPYLLHLPSGKNITLFFYNGPIAQAVAFENLLGKGENFADRLMSGFSPKRKGPQLVHIATDGETYGHHHRFGEMALAYALSHFEESEAACITNYGEFLEKFPPVQEVEIYEDTSWSCAHGIERWRSDCGCHTGGDPAWNQAWRTPLREALDWLRDSLAPVFQEKAKRHLKDPWAARNDYIRLLLDRSPENVKRFLKEHASGRRGEKDAVLILKLLEMQHHTMLMYTSCGWFFNDISGIETRQILLYAGRALELAEEISGHSWEPRFLELLEPAESNIPEQENGRKIYENTVKHSRVDLPRVCAQLAAECLFAGYPERSRIFCFRSRFEEKQTFENGRARLVLGIARLTSEVTQESSSFAFALLHEGDFHPKIHVKAFDRIEDYRCMVVQVTEVFEQTDFQEAARRLEVFFGKSAYSIQALLKNGQRKIFDTVLDSVLKENSPLFQQVYDALAPSLRFFKEAGMAAPKTVSRAVELVLNLRLKEALENENPRFDLIRQLVEEARLEGVSLDPVTLEYPVRQSMERLAEGCLAEPQRLSWLQRLEEGMRVIASLPFQINLWKTENICYDIYRHIYPAFRKKANEGDLRAGQWVRHFQSWAEALSVGAFEED